MVRSFAVGFSSISVFFPVQWTGPANTSCCHHSNDRNCKLWWWHWRCCHHSSWFPGWIQFGLWWRLGCFTSWGEPSDLQQTPHLKLSDSRSNWWFSSENVCINWQWRASHSHPSWTRRTTRLKNIQIEQTGTCRCRIQQSEKKQTKLYNYVKLSLISLDCTWTSRSVKALITPGLCVPTILGLPWLEHNTIIIDHTAHTRIDKINSYDLLNPPPVLPPLPPKPKLCKQIKLTKADKKLVLAEFMMICNDRLQHLKLKPEKVMEFNDRLQHLKLKPEKVMEFNVIGAVCKRIKVLAAQEILIMWEQKLKSEYKSVFEPIPHVNGLPSDIVTEIHIKDAEKTIKSWSYPSPRRYKDTWQILIQQHLDAGRIRPSSSPCASPAFIIPKANPHVLPQWVNDFRQLNENTVMDSHPLPRIDDILSDCAKGKIWATIDMTNSFFQTRMHPDHIHLTTVNPPLGLYKWLVMPMGLKNAPAIHQRWVTAALRHPIGKFCHIYLDDIVIWLNSVEEHEQNVCAVLQALQKAQLYINPNKTNLFCMEIDFLGHHISAWGAEADKKKVEWILSWPIPKSATETRGLTYVIIWCQNCLYQGGGQLCSGCIIPPTKWCQLCLCGNKCEASV